MIAKWILSIMGLCALPPNGERQVLLAHRQVRAAVSRHQRSVDSARGLALTIIDQVGQDARPQQMLRDSTSTRETIAEVLRRMGC